MTTLIESCVAWVDKRGEIEDLLTCQFDCVTRIRTNAGGVRGNHFHKETCQWTYIIRGRVQVVSQFPGEEPSEIIAKEGDLIEHIPFEHHAFRALTETEWLVFTRGPRQADGFESDTYRLEIPLLEQL